MAPCQVRSLAAIWMSDYSHEWTGEKLFKHPFGGNISEHGPTVITPGLGVVTLVADDNSTIDMTPDQAIHTAGRLIAWAEYQEAALRMAELNQDGSQN